MTNSSQRLGLFGSVRQWFTKTPERALDQAYEAALKICQIEDNYFDGNPIDENYGSYSRSAYRLLQKDQRKYLSIIRRRMAEFRASSNSFQLAGTSQLDTPLPEDVPLDQLNGPAIFFSKLQLVDAVLERYTAASSFPLNQLQSDQLAALSALPSNDLSTNAPKDDNPNEALSSRSSVLPRSILRTVDRIKQDLESRCRSRCRSQLS